MNEGAADYRLYCMAQSGNSYKVALMLELAGAPWTPVWVDFFNGGTRASDFVAKNEMAEVPLLEHAGKTLAQSGVILDYLTGTLGEFGPRDDDERREILRWTLWDNHKLTSYIATYRWMLNFLAKDKQDPAVIPVMWNESWPGMPPTSSLRMFSLVESWSSSRPSIASR